MRVIITGGTGQIGTALSHSLVNDGHEVIVLTRSPQQDTDLPAEVTLEHWDTKTGTGWAAHADGADAIVNLAGANLAGNGFLPSRWTAERKKLILESRLNAGAAVVDAVKQVDRKPGVVIQASAVGYYGTHSFDNTLTESAPPGDDFVADVCVQWEKSTEAVEEMGVRRCIIRTGVVLSFEHGALQRMALPFKLFAGGPLGSGKQPFPWIHPDDEVGAIRYLIENSQTSGVYNLTAPNPLTNAQFSRALGRVMSRPSLIPVPAFAFRMVFGEVAEIVVEGQKAVPDRLLEAGYNFKFTEADNALQALHQRQ